MEERLESFKGEENMTSIGFIGLGNMGEPMALNLLAKGHKLYVYDIISRNLEQTTKQGAEALSTPEELARKKTDFIVSMLPSSQNVEALYLQNALLDFISENTTIIDCSTISPQTSISLYNAAKAKNINCADAPVSGGVAGAEKGTLTFIVGAEKETFNLCQPILADMGSNVYHAGDNGSGQIVKICNNMLLGILMAGTSEALKLGVKNGVDAKTLTDIISQSSGNNWALSTYNPYPGVDSNTPASKDYAGGFLTKLMNKDLKLALDLASQSEASIPLGSAVADLYEQHIAANDAADLDFSSIIKLYGSS
jgi:3-hydroxyisobutyrate dehydrogenase